MDYRNAPITFKVRKVARYVRLYGPSKTITKVRGQYHMGAEGRPVPQLRPPHGADAHVGIIGCGLFAYSTIGYYLSKKVGPVIRGAMDRNEGRAASLARRYGALYATTEAERVISDPKVDLVYIASNHASHADYAVAALNAGKSVHIEKPHAVTETQLAALCRAMVETGGKVRIGFNRPYSRLGMEVGRYLGQQSGQTMFNWFVAGHEIAPEHWYFKPEEGGRVLGNLCHWTDFVLQMVPPENRFPIEIKPARAEQSDADIAVSFVFGDGSIAVITFSAKGHAFEGVRERLSLHKGDLLLELADFKELKAHVCDKRHTTRLRFRDHGHSDSILRSYGMSSQSDASHPGVDVAYVWETGQLVLQTKEALERNETIYLDRFRPESLIAENYDAREARAVIDSRG